MEKTSSQYTMDYPCNEGSGDIVPSACLVCPHCGESKGQHLVNVFTKVCGALMNNNIMVGLQAIRPLMQTRI